MFCKTNNYLEVEQLTFWKFDIYLTFCALIRCYLFYQECSVNMYVKILIFPDFVDNFPDFSPIFAFNGH